MVTEGLQHIAGIIHTIPERCGVVTDTILDHGQDQSTELILKEDAIDG